MSEDAIDVEKAWKDLKGWLKIQDEDANNTSNQKEPTKFELVFSAIEARSRNWFTSDNLLVLLKKIKKCKIYVTAKDVHNILKVFKNQNQDLKFNNFGKFALEPIEDKFLTDCYLKDWEEFYGLLEFLIDNIDKNEDDDLVLSDVLKKIREFKIPQMTNLLEVWNKKNTNNKKSTGEKADVVKILEHIGKMNNEQSAQDMAKLLKQLNEIHALSTLDNPEKISDQILKQLSDRQWAICMCSLAEQLKGCLAEYHTTQILNKTIEDNAGNMYALVKQLPLTPNHLKAILSKLESKKSKATDVLELVDELIKIGLEFDKNSYQNVLNYLDDVQTVDDVYNFLDRFKNLGVTLKTNIVRDIINKLSSYQTVADVCNLLDNFKNLGVTLETNIVHNIINKLSSDQTVNDVRDLLDKFKEEKIALTEDTACNIVNKLKFGLTVNSVSTLLEKFQDINVPLNLNKGNYANNVVHAIVKKFQLSQSAQNLLDLVKTLQEFNIQPIANTCKQILNCLGGNQNAGDVADLLINLGNLAMFVRIQDNQSLYLPDIYAILQKIGGNQTAEDMLKLAKMLIAMGKNLRPYSKNFKSKIKGYTSDQVLEDLLNLKYNFDEYRTNQGKFVKEFQQEIKSKESEKESNVGQLIYSNSQLNVGQKEKENLNNIGEKLTNGAVLKILGGIFAVLGIICIVLSFIIAKSVLLGLLILGCVLFAAGIFILVGLFLKNKYGKPINLVPGNEDAELNRETKTGMEQNISLEKNQNINQDYNKL